VVPFGPGIRGRSCPSEVLGGLGVCGWMAHFGQNRCHTPLVSHLRNAPSAFPSRCAMKDDDEPDQDDEPDELDADQDDETDDDDEDLADEDGDD
jgi:hypothetical protein